MNKKPYICPMMETVKLSTYRLMGNFAGVSNHDHMPPRRMQGSNPAGSVSPF